MPTKAKSFRFWFANQSQKLDFIDFAESLKPQIGPSNYSMSTESYRAHFSMLNFCRTSSKAPKVQILGPLKNAPKY